MTKTNAVPKKRGETGNDSNEYPNKHTSDFHKYLSLGKRTILDQTSNNKIAITRFQTPRIITQEALNEFKMGVKDSQ